MAKEKQPEYLAERHYVDLKRIQKSCKRTLEFLTKCDKCKLDVEQEIAATKDQLDVISKLIKEFFPNQPE